MMVYISASTAVPLIAWKQEAPAFHVRPLGPEDDHRISGRFDNRSVVYVGSSEGCGCGFGVTYRDGFVADSIGDLEEEDARLARQRDRSAFLDLLRSLVKAGPVQIYACWDGDEAAPADGEERLTFEELARDFSRMRERTLLTLVK